MPNFPSKAGFVMYFGIQYLRAIAALFVVLFHAAHTLTTLSNQDTKIFEFGAGGVDIFFVISGVIMWITTQDRTPTPAGFFLNRIKRIVPLYWLLTAFQVSLMLALPSIFVTAQFDLPHILASLIFLPHEHPTMGVMAPVLVAGWTLNFEMFFYLLFAFTLFLPQNRRVMAMIGLFLGLVLLGHFLQPGPFLAFYTAPLILEFLAGVLLAAWVIPWLSTKKTSIGLAWAVLALGTAWIILGPAQDATGLNRLWIWGMPSILIVGSVLLMEHKKPIPKYALPALLGASSYSLYLSHTFALPVLRLLSQKLNLAITNPAAAAAFFATSVIVCAIGGILTYWIVEKPIAQLLHRKRPISH